MLSSFCAIFDVSLTDCLAERISTLVFKGTFLVDLSDVVVIFRCASKMKCVSSNFETLTFTHYSEVFQSVSNAKVNGVGRKTFPSFIPAYCNLVS